MKRGVVLKKIQIFLTENKITSCAYSPRRVVASLGKLNYSEFEHRKLLFFLVGKLC